MQVCPPAMLVHEDLHPSFVTLLTCPFLQVWVCGTRVKVDACPPVSYVSLVVWIFLVNFISEDLTSTAISVLKAFL